MARTWARTIQFNGSRCLYWDVTHLRLMRESIISDGWMEILEAHGMVDTFVEQLW